MAPRRDIDARLLADAYFGRLRRSNTRPGTPERRAVDRVTYLRRRERLPGLSARQALGHPGRGDVPPSISLMVDDSPRYVIVEGLTRRDVRRAARYDSLVGQLVTGRMSPTTFRRRVRGWRPIAGYRFLSDPAAVMAIVESRRAADEEIFVYRSGRAT